LTARLARFDDPPMMLARRLFLVFAFVLAAMDVAAQSSDTGKLLDEARQRIADARKQLDGGDVDDAALAQLREQMGAVDTHANTLLGELAPKLEAITARIDQLGPAPAKGGEARDIAVQRAELEKQRSALDADIKRAKLLIVDSGQVVAQVADTRRANFQARLSQRTPSPLTPTFWRGLGASLDRDLARARELVAGMVAGTTAAFAPANRVASFVGVGLGVLLVLLGRWWVERALLRWTADRVPHGRLRRSALAVALVVATTLLTGLGAQAIVVALDWHGVFGDDARALARSIVAAVVFGSYVTGLGRALLAAARPSWRLPPISDDVAVRLRHWPLMLGSAVALSVLIKHFNQTAGTSLSATIAGSLVVALVYAGLIGWGLLRAARTPAVAGAHAESLRRPAWVGAAMSLLWIGVALAIVASLAGYVAFAHQVTRQMIGLGIVAATFYLVVHVVEDLLAAALSSRAHWAQRTLGLEPRVLDQVAVLASGAFRVFALAIALFAALAPFGTEPADLVAQLGRTAAGLRIGQIEVTPVAVFGALAVLVLGIAAVRALQRWLLVSYLPTTRLDPGMRSSMTTLLGTAGIVVVVAFALSALGFGLDRIAWVASALSVGIGFGLQAIVQNFVSGLILLVERPVKVGDWVVLGDTEGDIRRINVRATEIQMGDRSTVIVPNSELITKSVRNVTLANAEGRVRFRVPLPLDSDPARVVAIIKDAFDAHPGVLRQPAPNVLLDSIENGHLMFVVVGFVANPRQAGQVRSDLLLDILARLRAEGIALSAPYQVNLGRAGEADLPHPPREVD
jgi:small-conductance mechanosensitive channel